MCIIITRADKCFTLGGPIALRTSVYSDIMTQIPDGNDMFEF